MDSKHVEEKIEALLFYKVSPIAIGELAEVLSLTSDEVHIGLDALEQSLVGRGIQLMRSGNNVALATAPAASATIEKSRREELARDLGKAALETLAIVLYRAPVTRSGIDYIRGVNSTFTLRNLLVRGLIERVPNPKDQRSYLYQPTIELLGHLGVTHIEELPEFATVQQELQTFEQGLIEETDA